MQSVRVERLLESNFRGASSGVDSNAVLFFESLIRILFCGLSIDHSSIEAREMKFIGNLIFVLLAQLIAIRGYKILGVFPTR